MPGNFTLYEVKALLFERRLVLGVWVITGGLYEDLAKGMPAFFNTPLNTAGLLVMMPVTPNFK